MRRKTMVQTLRMPVSILAGTALFSILVLSQNIWDRNNSAISGILFFAGLMLVGVAMLGRQWCMVFISGYKSKMLITEGPYSMTRNPLYLFSLIGFIGVGLCSGTFTLPVIIGTAFAVYYPFVISGEESKLRSLHGAEFEKYEASTPRFFPKISLLREPETYVVNPRIFIRHMSYLLLFPLLAGLVGIVVQLHRLNIIPHYFYLY